MRVRHKPGTAERLFFGGVIYEAIAPGRFEVPYEVGQQLIRWPDWEIDTEPLGEVPFDGEAETGGETPRRRRRSRGEE